MPKTVTEARSTTFASSSATSRDRVCQKTTRRLGLLRRMLKAVARRHFARRSLRVGLVEFQSVNNLAAYFYGL